MQTADVPNRRLTDLRRALLQAGGGGRSAPQRLLLTTAIARYVLERSPVSAALVVGEEHLLAYANPAFGALFGVPPSELVGRPLAAGLPGVGEALRELLGAARGGETRAPQAVHLPGARGATRRLCCAAWPATDDEGRPVAALLEVEEASPAERHAAFLLEAGRRLASLEIEQALVSVAQLVTGSLGALCAFDFAATDRQVGLTGDGRRLLVALEAHGRILGRLALVRDRSVSPFEPEEVAVVEDLARAVAAAVDGARLVMEAQQAARVREAFLARASHELRTPLTVVKGHLALLAKRHRAAGDPEADRLLEVATRHVEAMERLTSDLLDVSHLTGGEFCHAAPMDLALLAGDGLLQVEPLAREKGVRMEAALPERLPIVGDRLRLEQVVLHLLTNALRHTPSGGAVRIAGRALPDRVELRVVDTGSGIDPADLEAIFQPFYQVGSATGRRKAAGRGAGLGLAVVRRLVELHRGRVWAESRGRGHGSTFVVTLPSADSLR